MLLSIFQWIQDTSVGLAIRESLWMFPIIEAFHLLGLALIGGAVLLVDMRLAGVALRDQPLSQLASDAEPWLFGSLAVMLLSGFLLFTSEAIKCYYNPAFWLKMLFLSLAITFTFTVRRRVAAVGEAKVKPIWRRAVAVVSVTLWSGVGLMGRGIGFY
jgi:uncharacterized protein DUF6644